MYELDQSISIGDVPNPVEMELDYTMDDGRANDEIVFLGRLEAQKRVWIVCEIAKLLPEFQFYIVGATGRGRDEAANSAALSAYRNADGSSKIENLHFVGHLDNEAKKDRLKRAKILINTSIWEGIPVSWLEALSYGCVIVSAFDRDDIVSRFGTFVGEALGDGTDEASLGAFVSAIRYWMSQEGERKSVGWRGVEYVRDRHTIDHFTSVMREEIIALVH